MGNTGHWPVSPGTRRAERGARPKPIKTGVLEENASLFRSASRRPARAGRPCYPFSGHALAWLFQFVGWVSKGGMLPLGFGLRSGLLIRWNANETVFLHPGGVR